MLSLSKVDTIEAPQLLSIPRSDFYGNPCE
jgi:hypothetical protein